jgi:hypothetical protein
MFVLYQVKSEMSFGVAEKIFPQQTTPSDDIVWRCLHASAHFQFSIIE